MYKKIMLVLLISSPLLAVVSQGISKRVEGTFVAPSLTQNIKRDTRGLSTNGLEDLKSCLCFFPRLAIFGSLAVGVAKGALEKVKPKTD